MSLALVRHARAGSSDIARRDTACARARVVVTGMHRRIFPGFSSPLSMKWSASWRRRAIGDGRIRWCQWRH